MRILLAALCGFGLDLILGDPEMLTPIHPVVLMGHCITALEKLLRKHFPKNRQGELLGGLLLAITLPAGTLLICLFTLALLNRLWPPLAFGVECVKFGNITNNILKIARQRVELFVGHRKIRQIS